MKKMLICAVSLVAAVTMTACGSSHNSPSSNSSSPSSGSGGGSGNDALKAEIKAKILADQTGSATDPFRMDAAKAECTANAVVDALGVDKLRSYGLITADNKLTTRKFTTTHFSTADATTVVDVLFQCLGGSTFTSTIQHAIESGLPATMPSSVRTCIESKLNVAAVKNLIIAELSGHGTAGAEMDASITACMSK